MNSDEFTTNELLEMYVLLADHIAENIDIIDSGDYGPYTKNELLDNNKLCNSAKRKLAKMLKSVGIDPAKLMQESI